MEATILAHSCGTLAGVEQGVERLRQVRQRAVVSRPLSDHVAVVDFPRAVRDLDHLLDCYPGHHGRILGSSGICGRLHDRAPVRSRRYAA